MGRGQIHQALGRWQVHCLQSHRAYFHSLYRLTYWRLPARLNLGLYLCRLHHHLVMRQFYPARTYPLLNTGGHPRAVSGFPTRKVMKG